MIFDELENTKQLLIQFIAEIRAWMLLHQFKLSNEKTEFIALQSPHNLGGSGYPNFELPKITLKSTDAACWNGRHNG